MYNRDIDCMVCPPGATDCGGGVSESDRTTSQRWRRTGWPDGCCSVRKAGWVDCWYHHSTVWRMNVFCAPDDDASPCRKWCSCGWKTWQGGYTGWMHRPLKADRNCNREQDCLLLPAAYPVLGCRLLSSVSGWDLLNGRFSQRPHRNCPCWSSSASKTDTVLPSLSDVWKSGSKRRYFEAVDVTR